MEPIENILKGKSFKSAKSERRFIFKQFRRTDESHKWPISGRFSATERAIRFLRRFEYYYGQQLAGLELVLFLDRQISEIVNQAA
jgi:hypothetical protein